MCFLSAKKYSEIWLWGKKGRNEGKGEELVRKENKVKTCKGLISVGSNGGGGGGQVTEIKPHVYIYALSGRVEKGGNRNRMKILQLGRK